MVLDYLNESIVITGFFTIRRKQKQSEKTMKAKVGERQMLCCPTLKTNEVVKGQRIQSSF
jgi:hypothetical protein